MDISILPTLNISIEHEIEIYHTPHRLTCPNSQWSITRCAIDIFHQFCIPLDHEHTNNDNGANNGATHGAILKLVTQDPLINTCISFTSWPFHPSYESCNQSHDGNDIGTMGESRYKHWHWWTQASCQCILTFETVTQLAQQDSNFDHTHQLANSYDVKHVHNPKSSQEWLQWWLPSTILIPYLKLVHTISDLREKAIVSNNDGFHK
jgi:hypothetical protein